MYCKTIIAFAAWVLVARAAQPMAQPITVGVTGTMSDAPIYIAAKKRYFSDEGLDVNVTTFRSAADMVAPLGTGQIEAGAGSFITPSRAAFASRSSLTRLPRRRVTGQPRSWSAKITSRLAAIAHRAILRECGLL
jgi:ABC-type nitrate/sulfonate/bicarbonate transport system substrate-binding protein